MDPVAQTLAQQGSGSAEGQGFGQFYAEGVRQGQNQQQINLSRQRLTLEQQQEARAQHRDDMLLPLTVKQQELENTNLGIQATANQLKLDQVTQQNAVLPELLDLQMRFQNNPDGYGHEVLVDEYKGLVRRYPQAFVAGPGAEIRQGIEADAMLSQWSRQVAQVKQAGGSIKQVTPDKSTILEYPSLHGGGVLPEAKTLSDPTTGKPITVITDGNRWERVPESSLGRQLNVMETKALYAADPSLLVHDPNTGALMADPTRPDAVQRALQVGAGITSATRSKAEEGVSKLAEVINTAQEEIANVQAHPEALGIMGAGRSALEIAKGVAGVSSDATVTNARDRLRENFTRLAKTLRTDSGNMSHYEQVQLHEVGDLTKLDQYPGRAIPLMQNILNAAVGQKLRKLKELNKPIDTQTFQAIQPSEVQGLYDSDLLQNKDLLDLVKSGKVDKAKVREIIVNKPKG